MDQLGGDLMPTLARIAPHIDSLVVALTTIASDPALLRSVQRLDDIMANLEVSTKNLNAAMAGVPALVNTANGTMTNVKEISANLTQISAALAVVSEDLKTMPLDWHVPALTDYDPNHAMDPLLIFSNSAYPSYPDFLWKMLDRDQRKHLPVLTETQLQFLRFVSTQWADGRRPLELLLVKALLEPDWQTAFGRLLKDFDIRLTDQEARCLMAEFTRTWLSGSGADTCPDAV